MEQQQIAETNPDQLTSNPLGAFRLIKTLASDAYLIKNDIKTSIDEYEKKVSRYTPKPSDLSSVARAFHNLQETFDLKTADLAEGIINGEKFSDPLSAHDLLVIGQHLVQLDLNVRSIEYLKLALRRTPTDPYREVQPTQVFSSWAQALENLGRFKTAVGIIDEMLRLEPNNRATKVRRQKLVKKAAQKKVKTEKFDETFEPETQNLCGGRISLSDEKLSKLHCRLLSPNVHSLLSPFKLEEAYLDPHIILFHDVISDKEIQILKDISRRRLFQSKIVTISDGKTRKDTSFRVSKVAWLEESLNPVIVKISKRIEDLTGLTMKTSEDLQIQQYGLGGYYKAHHDAFSLKPGETIKNGNRIATLMFYVRQKAGSVSQIAALSFKFYYLSQLSDVKQGGATVFPHINLKISAERGAAVFWHNLLPSGVFGEILS